MKFADQLKAARKRLNLTQAELAEILQCSKSAVEKWEQDVSVPPIFCQEGIFARLANVRDERPGAAGGRGAHGEESQ